MENVKKQITRNHKKIKIRSGAESAGVYKQKEFDDFVLWLSLPGLLKGKSAEYLGMMGINDDEAIPLLEIKNLTDFAAKYDIEPATLTTWKKKAKELNLIDQARDFYKGLSNNVFHAFYIATLKHGDAARFREWREEFLGKELPPPPIALNQNILTPQFSQVINSLKVEYKEKLRTYYGEQIKKSDEVRSPERVRTDRPNK